ncbi:hypothetical protein [Rubinisphaera italica]|uniref:Zinc-finger domain-containing protein n=1 Tax=Rubinisphaera italica TaxID=2527969 RepID=A0A5C5XDG4_9PLAN|nr:hypothetical protein [Rubinisphaera italica]TWT61040.1 hypothetical protein Pan54_17730 [Rubinisphaera italica]
MGETMSCRCIENREKLALLVGRDAPDKLPEALRRSVSSCPTCRDHYRGLCESIGMIDRVHDEPVPELKASLWNSLSQRLPEKRVSRNRHQDWKQHFFPVFSLTAACLALAIVFLDGRFQDNQQRVYQTTSAKGVGSYSLLPLSPVLDEESAAYPQASSLQFEPNWSGRKTLSPLFNNPDLLDQNSPELSDQFLEDMQKLKASRSRMFNN